MNMFLGEAKIPSGLRVYSIGDIHGCLSELLEILELIQQDIKENPVDDWRIVFVGDYVDRGPMSSGVIEQLVSLRAKSDQYVFLRGNHDDYFWSFLVDPHRSSDMWFNNGAEATFVSYGASIQPGGASQNDLDRLHGQMLRKVPRSHLDFLGALPMRYEIGDYLFVHAGVRPNVALNEQSDHDLMWIRQPFLRHEGSFGKVVVHGHTPNEPDMEIRNNRINLDTMAFITGRLTAVVLENDNWRKLQTRGAS